ncbi:hypothetical protein HDU76_003516, partial [Blyttiomyces sp. JEL0837]
FWFGLPVAIDRDAKPKVNVEVNKKKKKGKERTPNSFPCGKFDTDRVKAVNSQQQQLNSRFLQMPNSRHEGPSVVFSPSLATVKEEKRSAKKVGTIKSGTANIEDIKSPAHDSSWCFALLSEKRENVKVMNETTSRDVMILYPTDINILMKTATAPPPPGKPFAKIGGSMTSVAVVGLEETSGASHMNSTRMSNHESTTQADREYYSSGGFKHKATAKQNAQELQSDKHEAATPAGDRRVNSNSSSKASSRRGSLDTERSRNGSTDKKIGSSPGSRSIKSGSFVSFANSSKSNRSSGSSSTGGSRRSVAMTNKNILCSRTEISSMRSQLKPTTMNDCFTAMPTISKSDQDEYFSDSASKSRNRSNTNALGRSTSSKSGNLQELTATSISISSMQNTHSSSVSNVSREPSRKNNVEFRSGRSRRRSLGEPNDIWTTTMKKTDNNILSNVSRELSRKNNEYTSIKIRRRSLGEANETYVTSILNELSIESSRKINEYNRARARRKSLPEGCGVGWDNGVISASLCESLEDYTTKEGYIATPTSGSAVGSRRNSVMSTSPTVESVTLSAPVSKNTGRKSIDCSDLKMDGFGTRNAGNNVLKRVFEKFCKFALKNK